MNCRYTMSNEFIVQFEYDSMDERRNSKRFRQNSIEMHLKKIQRSKITALSRNEKPFIFAIQKIN